MEAGGKASGSGRAGKIPCVVMHEHRDAYYCWMHFIREGFIAKSGNYLLHVDHHADYAIGLYGWDLAHMPQTPEEALRFTDADLGIEDFIVPALWQGIFDTFHSLRNVMPASFADETHLLHLKDGNILKRRQAMTPAIEEAARAHPERYRLYTYRQGGLHHGDRIDAGSVVLDVDLDYFCPDNSLRSVPAVRVEITRAEYENYRNDRYHPLRILPSHTFDAEVVGGKYYLVMRDKPEIVPLPSDRLILSRMDRLLSYLVDQKVQPRAIDVCRSTISGYLPAEKAEFVERNFMERLGELYPLQMVKLPAI